MFEPGIPQQQVVKSETLSSFASEFSLVHDSGVIVIDQHDVPVSSRASNLDSQAPEPSSESEPTTSTDSSETSCDGGQKDTWNVPKAPAGYRLWQHRKSRVLHIAKEEYRRIRLGRSLQLHLAARSASRRTECLGFRMSEKRVSCC